MSTLASRLIFRLLESDDLDDRMLGLDTDNPYFSDFDYAEICGIIAEVLKGQSKNFRFEKEVQTEPSQHNDRTLVDVTITFRLAEKHKSISPEQWTEMRSRIKDYIGDTKDYSRAIVLMHGRDRKPTALRKILILYAMS